jgi:Ca2+:H+ antiporter
MVRRLLWGSLVLAPVVGVADALGADKTLLFVLAAVALVPLAWLIGESTEHAAEHTGPGIGGFLNASFGNAPELIIALLAVGSDLPNVVRGSLAGSVVSNLLLVLGISFVVAGRGSLDRRSLLLQLGTVLLAIALVLVPAAPGWHGNPERHGLVVATIPVAALLLAVYAIVTLRSLRRHRRLHVESGGDAHADAWSLPAALAALAAATLATAFVSEVLVSSLDAFAHAVGLSEFALAAVVVATVGNAAEHGGSIVIAHRGKTELASEIAVSSSAQVLVFVTPLVALLSLAFPHALPFAFRPVEVGALAGAALLATAVVARGRATRTAGAVLVAGYALFVLAVLVSGDRPSVPG